MGFIENNKLLHDKCPENTICCLLQRLWLDRFSMHRLPVCIMVKKQTDPANPGLRESDAYPALAEDGYGIARQRELPNTEGYCPREIRARHGLQ